MEFVSVQGARVPALGFGTWDLRGKTCTRMIRAALEIGYRHIDTAQIYENEAQVGEGMAVAGVDRGEIFLTTKVWMDRLDRKGVLASTEDSLKRLRTDHVDLLLIHWPNPAFDLAETLHAMEELQKKGRTRHIGISNFPVALMREAVERIGARVFCNQVEYHPFLSQNAVLDYARRHDILVTAYSPLAQGENGIFRNKTLNAIAETHGKSVPQVVLRWLIQQKNVAAIPRTAKEGHAASNFDIFDFKLSAAEMKQISGLAGNRRVIDPSWAPAWDAA